MKKEMKSISNKASNSEIIGRINNLNPMSQPLWGKMNAAQMLAHSTVGLKIALGEIIPSSNFFMKLMGKLFKKRIFARESFRKNSPTGKEFIITGDKNFIEEKSTLISYIKKCADKGKDAYTKESHPFFGNLTPEEWDILNYRHLDHHLKQFNV